MDTYTTMTNQVSGLGLRFLHNGQSRKAVSHPALVFIVTVIINLEFHRLKLRKKNPKKSTNERHSTCILNIFFFYILQRRFIG